MRPSQAILLDAAKLIEEIGWRSGVYAIDKNRNLLMPTDQGIFRIGMLGAVIRAAANDIEHPPAFLCHEARWLLRNFLNVKDLAAWEDEAGRTKKQVLNALKGASESQEAPPPYEQLALNEERFAEYRRLRSQIPKSDPWSGVRIDVV